MGTFVAQATERLREHGYRITSPRRRILAVLEKATGPFTAADIHQALQAEPRPPDLVTVYRVLAVLESLRIVHETHTEAGYIACRALDAEHHQPLLCVRCGGFVELAIGPLGEMVRNISVDGWEMLGNVIEFTGICPDCRAREAAG